jgi:hypothetical protein
MYPAIQANIDRIAQEAFELWRTGSPVEPLIKQRLTEANMSDWIRDVRMTMTRLIHDNHLNSKL